MKTKHSLKPTTSKRRRTAGSLERVVGLLAEVLEREILTVNKAAYSMSEPYQPACIAIGATLKRIADALRAESKKQPNNQAQRPPGL